MIIHYMIIEQRRERFNRDGTAGKIIHSNDPLTDIRFTDTTSGCTQFSQGKVKISDDMKLKATHKDLLWNLVEHQWDVLEGMKKHFLSNLKRDIYKF